MGPDSQALVREFVDAFNREDLDRMVGTLDPEVELQTMKSGLIRGRDAARKWATRTPGGVQQEVELDVIEDNGDRVLGLGRQVWRWEETGELAEENPMAALFTIRDGLIIRWQPFRDFDEARAAAGLG